MTLSQRGLSVHIMRSVSWIRKQGDVVQTSVFRGQDGQAVYGSQMWRAMRYADGRLIGYELSLSLAPVA